MATVATRLAKKSLDSPDEVRIKPKTRVEIARVGEHTLMRGTLEPGWRWSEHLKPEVGTDLCEVGHLGYLLSGSMTIRLTDGTEETIVPGDFVEIPPGHDAWVIGDEPAVFLDFAGGEAYLKELG